MDFHTLWQHVLHSKIPAIAGKKLGKISLVITIKLEMMLHHYFAVVIRHDLFINIQKMGTFDIIINFTT